MTTSSVKNGITPSTPCSAKAANPRRTISTFACDTGPRSIRAGLLNPHAPFARCASGPFVELPRGMAVSRLGGLDREQRPSPRDALEVGVASRGEFDLGADYEIPDGA